MSGGHWNYMSDELLGISRKNSEVWRLMAALEHELDWGICSDTCLDCARIRVALAVEKFFDAACEDAIVAIAIARDQDQNQCTKCKAR